MEIFKDFPTVSFGFQRYYVWFVLLSINCHHSGGGGGRMCWIAWLCEWNIALVETAFFAHPFWGMITKLLTSRMELPNTQLKCRRKDDTFYCESWSFAGHRWRPFSSVADRTKAATFDFSVIFSHRNMVMVAFDMFHGRRQSLSWDAGHTSQ